MSTDGWTSLDEMCALSNAQTVDEFHRRIVLLPPVDRNRADSFEPVCLFAHHHQNERKGAATSALLLVTDSRWRNATGRIMSAIAESALIDDDDLDLLAQCFLAADRCVYWRAPEEWFEDGIEITLEDVTGRGTERPHTASAPTDGRPIVIAREIRPPLRRWAAARLVRRNADTWGSVLQRSGGLDARSGAAVMLGLLDAIDSLPGPAQSVLRRRAADWPHRDVRVAVEKASRKPSLSAPVGSSGSSTPDTNQVTPPNAGHTPRSQQERLV